MGFAIVCDPENDRLRPALICDQCKKEVVDWKMALVLFPCFEGGVKEAVLLHKGECDRAFEKKIDRAAYGWHGLSRYIPWLLWNNEWWSHKIEIDDKTGAFEKDAIVVPVPKPLL